VDTGADRTDSIERVEAAARRLREKRLSGYHAVPPVTPLSERAKRFEFERERIDAGLARMRAQKAESAEPAPVVRREPVPEPQLPLVHPSVSPGAVGALVATVILGIIVIVLVVLLAVLRA
jgi:hypothetical protein